MPLFHIVLFNIKDVVISNGFEDFKQICASFSQAVPIVAEKAKEVKFGPPEYPGRNQGYNWGLYTVFETRADYDVYRDDEAHGKFVKNNRLPNTDGLIGPALPNMMA